MLACLKYIDEMTNLSLDHLRRGLELQQRAYGILDGLNIAIIEVDEV